MTTSVFSVGEPVLALVNRGSPHWGAEYIKEATNSYEEALGSLQRCNPERWGLKGSRLGNMRPTFVWLYLLTKYGVDLPLALVKSRVDSQKKTRAGTSSTTAGPTPFPATPSEDGNNTDCMASDSTSLPSVAGKPMGKLAPVAEVHTIGYDLWFDCLRNVFIQDTLPAFLPRLYPLYREELLRVKFVGNPFMGGHVVVRSPIVFLEKAELRLVTRDRVTLGQAEVVTFRKGGKDDRTTGCFIPESIYDTVKVSDIEGVSLEIAFRLDANWNFLFNAVHALFSDFQPASEVNVIYRVGNDMYDPPREWGVGNLIPRSTDNAFSCSAWSDPIHMGNIDLLQRPSRPY
ncbi:hypothetical protein DFP72DRAFT_895813 [Ephemerocybe angulata]|uniref:Uncharacterized protein n=1 Tax=Ephemerocybe angulata TaxID=980116 RepID=A0A8H6HZ89_9AGAR|nr:hypothetical protein DFP72DRAFT_895813 [Tulosesus angulatus]